jgi:hypothetical protein
MIVVCIILWHRWLEGMLPRLLAESAELEQRPEFGRLA